MFKSCQGSTEKYFFKVFASLYSPLFVVSVGTSVVVSRVVISMATAKFENVL